MKTQEWQRLSGELNRASKVMLTNHLRYRGLAAGFNDTKKEVIERFRRYANEGMLEGDALHKAALEFQEFNNKSVYLHTVSKTALKKLKSLPNQVAQWSGARIPVTPSSPRIAYSFLDNRVVKVTFAETQKKAEIDYNQGIVTTVEATRIVSLEVERSSGFVFLAFDPALTLNPHGSRLAYYKYYQDQAQSLLGAVLSRFDMTKALKSLEKSDLVELPYGRSGVKGGIVDLAADGRDYRTMDVYDSVKGSINVKKAGRYIWLPIEDQPEPPRLLRKVPTDVDATTSLVRFTKHVLREEVEYVLGKVRDNA